MLKVKAFYTIFVGILLFNAVFNVVLVFSHSAGEHAYMDVVEYLDKLNRDAERNLTVDEVDQVIDILWERVQCSKMDFGNSSCEECLSAESLLTIVGADTLLGLDQEKFTQASVILLYYLTDLQAVCKEISEPSAKDYQYFVDQLLTYDDPSNVTSTVLTYHQFDHILDDVNKTYVAENFAKCFTSHDLFYHDVTLENSTIGADEHELEELSVVSISYYLFGYCYGNPTEIHPDSFIDSVYDLYGHDGIISIHSFEEMLLKLGIGGGHTHEEDSHSHALQIQERSKRATANEDDDHDQDELSVYQCFDSHDLLHIHGVNESVGINEQEFVYMSPALIQQILSDACVAEPVPLSAASWEMYLWGTLIVFIITCTSLAGILVIPLANKSVYFKLMQTMISLAVGVMVSDALLHLIPHALHLHDHSGGDSHDMTNVWKMTVVFAAIYFFFLLERTVALMSENWKKSKANDTGHAHYSGHHGHSHSGKPEVFEDKMKTNLESSRADLSVADTIEAERIRSVNVEETQKPRPQITNTLATIIVVGDSLHNFIDGLAIGAALCIDLASGVATGLAILLHEIPHELGDFAILVSTGLSHKVALLWNLFCACWCFLGLYIGLAIGSIDDLSSWLLAITAGMFLYVALVDMMQELMAVDVKDPWTIFALQNAGILVGFAIILLISIFENDIHA